jgi:hypothetical protein
MADDDPLSLRFLCAAYADAPDTIEFYALDDDPHGDAPPEQVNRVNGMPLGVSDERWPVDEDGRRYAHICTLDLATMPALAALEPGFRAAVLFVCDPALEGGDGSPQFVHRWVMLRAEEVARGVVATTGRPAWGPEDREPARPFRVEAHRVPRAAFDPRNEDPRLGAVRAHLLGLNARAGGPAVLPRHRLPWLPDAFFLQLGESFGGINAGDGFAYVDRSRIWCAPP